MTLRRLAALPQFWLLPFGLAGWVLGQVRVLALPAWPGCLLIALGLGLMLWASVVMRRARTTVWPGQVPAALVTWGPFALSRNPIYLGDLLILSGFLLALGLPVGLIMVPVFAAFLAQRFIRAEEAMAQAAFGTGFDRYCATTRRWL